MPDKIARSDVELREDLNQLRIVARGEASTEPSNDTGRRRRRRVRSDGAPRRRGVRKSLWLLLIVSAGFAGSSYFMRQQGLEPTEVRLTAVTRRDLGVPPVVLTAVGYVTPLRRIVVSSKAQGRIVEMPIEENQRVRAGDLLVRLEDEEARANFALVQAESADAARELELTRKLFQRGVRPQNALDRAQTSYERAQARVQVARVALEDRVLRAPFDGTVVRKLSDLGEFLNLAITPDGMPGTAVVELADLDKLDVELEINETELRKLELGMSALVLPEARPDNRYMGELIKLSSQADRIKGTVQAFVRINRPDEELLPGMTAKVRFLSRPPSDSIRVAIAVPASSVVRNQGRELVFVVEEGRARAVPVRTEAEGPEGAGGAAGVLVRRTEDGGFSAVVNAGPAAATAVAGERDADFVALLEGPPEGTYVIASPSPQIQNGSRVRIVQ